jgi:hypothetical protein
LHASKISQIGNPRLSNGASPPMPTRQEQK